jgi:hypothetical protein
MWDVDQFCYNRTRQPLSKTERIDRLLSKLGRLVTEVDPTTPTDTKTEDKKMDKKAGRGGRGTARRVG